MMATTTTTTSTVAWEKDILGADVGERVWDYLTWSDFQRLICTCRSIQQHGSNSMHCQALAKRLPDVETLQIFRKPDGDRTKSIINQEILTRMIQCVQQQQQQKQKENETTSPATTNYHILVKGEMGDNRSSTIGEAFENIIDTRGNHHQDQFDEEVCFRPDEENATDDDDDEEEEEEERTAKRARHEKIPKQCVSQFCPDKRQTSGTKATGGGGKLYFPHGLNERPDRAYCVHCLENDMNLAILFYWYNGLDFFDEDEWPFNLVWEDNDHDGEKKGNNFIVHICHGGVYVDYNWYFVGGPQHDEIDKFCSKQKIQSQRPSSGIPSGREHANEDVDDDSDPPSVEENSNIDER